VLDEAEAAAETGPALPWDTEESSEPGLPAETQALLESDEPEPMPAGPQAADSDWVFETEELSKPVEAEAFEPAGEEPLAPAELPDWLRDLEPEQGAEQPAPTSGAFPWEEPGDLDVSPAEPGEIPAWLAGAGAAAAGLAGLVEPPVSEEDTKPTRVSQSAEVSIPPELAGFITSEAEAPTPQAGPADELYTAPALETPGEAAETPAAEAGQAEAEAAQVEEAGTGFAAVYTVFRQPPVEETPVVEEPAGESQAPSEPEGEAEPGGLPEWLQELGEVPEPLLAEAPAGSEVLAPESELSTEEDAAAFAWLESLAARQGAEEGLVVSPEERPETIPDWIAADVQVEPEIQKFTAQPEEGAGETGEPEELFAAETGAVVELQAEEQDAEQETLAPLETTQLPESNPAETDWTADVPDVESGAQTEAGLEDAGPALQGPVEAPGEEQAIPELPDWLAGIEEAPAKEPEWTPAAEIEAPGREAAEPAAGAAEPARLDLNQAALIDLERVPGIGFIRAQAILAYREAHGPLTGLDDLLDVQGFDSETLAQIQDRVIVQPPVEPESLAADQNQVILIQGRNALALGDREAALERYAGLIESNALLPEVIHDLRDEGLYRFPIDVAIWQALGDAYFRDGQLQQAIDAYTKAEELLR
jgi:competence ComEA-like helix-hairpin-helix protein